MWLLLKCIALNDEFLFTFFLKKEFQINLLILSPALTFSIWLTQSMQFSDRLVEQIFKSFQSVADFVSSFVKSIRHQRILPQSRYMRRFPKQIQEKWPITNINFFMILLYDPQLHLYILYIYSCTHPVHTFLCPARYICNTLKWFEFSRSVSVDSTKNHSN